MSCSGERTLNKCSGRAVSALLGAVSKLEALKERRGVKGLDVTYLRRLCWCGIGMESCALCFL